MAGKEGAAQAGLPPKPTRTPQFTAGLSRDRTSTATWVFMVALPLAADPKVK